MDKHDGFLDKFSILRNINLNLDEHEEIWNGVKKRMIRIKKTTNKRGRMNLFVGLATVIAVVIVASGIGLSTYFGHSYQMVKSSSSSASPPLYVAHNNVKPIVYYVLTPEKVNNVGKLITTIKPKKFTTKDDWETALFGDKIEIREIPGTDTTKAVAIKISPSPNYYVKAVAESKELYDKRIYPMFK